MQTGTPFFSELLGGKLQRIFGVGLLAGGYWGFHRGKPVPFAIRTPSWIFEARAPETANIFSVEI